MTYVQLFATLAFRRLDRSVREAVLRQVGGGAVAGANGAASQADLQLAGALTEAASRVWTALDIALAGEALAQRLLHGDAQGEAVATLAQAVCCFVEALPPEEFRDRAWRRRCRQELHTARRAGRLAAGTVSLADVARLSSFLDRFTNPDKPEQGEWGILVELGDELDQAGLHTLKTVLGFRCENGEPFMVRLVHALLRSSLERAPSAARDWFGADHGQPDDPWESALDVMADTLGRLGPELEGLLSQLDEAEPVTAEAGPPPDAPPLQLGIACYNRGEFDEAIVHFTAASALNPADFQAYAYRGDAHRLRCDYERAAADYDRAIALSPGSAALYVNRGVIHELRHETAAALADFGVALRLDPQNAAAYVNRGKLRVAQGSYREALTDLTQAVHLDRKGFWAYYYRGQAHLAQGAHTEAVADFTQVLKSNPRHTLAYTYRGRARYEQGDYTRALEDLTAAVHLHPQNVLAHVTRGHIHRLRNDTARAVQDYSKALRHDPQNAEVHRSRGIVLRLRGDRDRALADLNQAVRLNPRDAEAFYHRAQTYGALGRYGQAMLDYSQALRLNPRYVVAYLGRALLHERHGRFRQVIRDCTCALRVQANLAAAHYIRGAAYLSQGKYAQAVLDLSHAIRLDPHFPLGYNDRGLAYIHLGKLDAALADFERAIELDPENPLAHANRGIVQQLRGVDTEAWQDLMRGLQLSPRLVLSSWTRGWGSATREAYAQTLADYIEGRRVLEVRETDLVASPEDTAADVFRELPGDTRVTDTQLPAVRTTVAPSGRDTKERPAKATQVMPRAEATPEPPAPMSAAASARTATERPEHETPCMPWTEADDKHSPPPSPFEPDQELQCPECAKVFRWKVVRPRPDGRIRCPYCAALTAPRPVGVSAKVKHKRRQRRESREPFEFHLSIPRKLWVAAAVLLLGGGGYYYFAYIGARANGPVVIPSVTAADLWLQLKDTPETAGEKYVGRQIAVTGVVEQIRGAQADTPVLVLKAGDKASIECAVKVKDDLKKVRARQKVTVTGDCQAHPPGETPVQLTNCRVAPAGFDYE